MPFGSIASTRLNAAQHLKQVPQVTVFGSFLACASNKAEQACPCASIIASGRRRDCKQIIGFVGEAHLSSTFAAH